MIIEERLLEAETALHSLMTGRAIVSVTDENGESVSYTRAKVSDLQTYVRALKISLMGGPRRVTKIHFNMTKGL